MFMLLVETVYWEFPLDRDVDWGCRFTVQVTGWLGTGGVDGGGEYTKFCIDDSMLDGKNNWCIMLYFFRDYLRL
jgi:hypothetical protein